MSLVEHYVSGHNEHAALRMLPCEAPTLRVRRPAWLQRYVSRGLSLVFYPARQKGPRDDDWPMKNYAPDRYRNGMNVGVKTGTEITPGRFLADVDLDWAEGIVLVKRLLPSTGFGFGRASKSVSHAFYTTPEPVVSQSFKDVSS